MTQDRITSARSAGFDGRSDALFLWPFARLSTAAGFAVSFVAALVLFRAAPEIDIWFSSLFFERVPCPAPYGPDDICGGFPASRSDLLNALRDVFHVLPPAIAVALALAVIVRQMGRWTPRDGFSAGALAAILSLSLSAILIANMALKEVWGRPRPISTDVFAGRFPFVPAGDFSRLCVENCSFVSGEATAAFWLVGAAALVPARWRVASLVGALALATFIAGLRVAFGAHFLSDVVLGALISLTVFSVIAAAARH